ncbi:MAG TPA: NADH-quinone oxidoreductase subunit NuoB [Mycobacteriales bacterium]|nr:NADH-quinone oxidoreductase subunit NuoB [Mycobacteriales bacterium]
MVTAAPVRYLVDLGRTYVLSVYDVGLACCAVEFAAAVMARPDLFAEDTRADPPDAQVLVISGTLTDKMAPAVARIYAALPAPKYVISFGSCANCGGPYWDSYCVTKGVDQMIPVDVFVPGCPPRPEALVDALVQLHETVGGRE